MERKKLSTCSWLTGKGVGGVRDRRERRHELGVGFLVLSLSSFIGFEKLFGVGDVCFQFPSLFCFRVSFPVN